jgi:hypothetical protein
MRRLAEIIICVAILAPVGWSQSIPISGQVLSQYGSPVAGAQVYICSAAGSSGLPCSPPASIWQDYNLTIPAGNPTQTDTNGNFSVYVGALPFPNTYVVNMVTGYGPIYTQLYPGPSCPLSGCTFTGNVTAPLYNATLFPYYEINGVQISSSALSDSANIAYLNALNVFTGATQTAPIWNATTGFDVNGTPLASTDLSDSSNLARLNISNTFTGATNIFNAIAGTTINATSGFQVGGVAPLNHILVGNGVNYVDSATVPSGALPTVYYQTLQLAGTAKPQEPFLNFAAGFTVVDDPTHTRTNVSLNVNKVQLSLPATTVNANTCSSPATASLTGVTSISTFSTAFATNPTAATGWGANGGLVVELWPDASPDILDWAICNQTTSNITPTAITLNVGVN